ncbi:sulfotransferase [Halovulum dunhuangense]|uniref:Sulfotransferase n=1 Tax=Halovulum dunhuangense TaxID=1505036 RepID=A0A849L1W9_9RHOB|nr:sulfotransferase [Halovulum dunhuangense]NNU80296.1 sulfotransferase [Halovulum dunhuangense]
MPAELRAVLAAQRLGDLGRLARRAAGLSWLTRADFLPEIAPADAARLAALARGARGEGPAPVLILGIMPRSGTNYLHDLLALHPDICAGPGRLYEFPLLQAARGFRGAMDEFLAGFPRNAEVLGRWDALALLGGAWLRGLQSEAGARHVLLKSPHVQNLTLAPLIFPGARIILCLRDGRDVLDSTLHSFSRWRPGRKTFAQLAQEWRLGTEAILSFAPGGPRAHPDIMVLRYEAAVADPPRALGQMLAHCGLDPARLDPERALRLPVRGSSRSAARGDARWAPEAAAADFAPVARWAGWSAARKARFERIAGRALDLAGYPRHA